MKVSIETVARIYAAGRNTINLGLGFAASAGLVSVAQNKTLTDSLNDIYQGISLITHGAMSIWQVLLVVFGPIVGGILAWMAQRSAKTENKQASIIATAADSTDPKSDLAKAALVSASAALAKNPSMSPAATEQAKVLVVNAAAGLPDVQKVVAPSLADNPKTAPEVVRS